MKLSPEEAAQALNDIDSSRDGARRSLDRHSSARFFFLWGSAWIAASVLSYLVPDRAPPIWDGIVGVAGSISCWWAFRMRGFIDALDQAGGAARHYGQRYLATVLVSVALLAGIIAIAHPATPKQATAIIVLAMSLVYVLAGIWRSWQYWLPGAALAALTLLGYFALVPGFLDWIGIAGGAVLFLTGLWFQHA